MQVFPHRRQGSIYVVVLGTSMIVALLAMTTISLQLTQLRHANAIAEVGQARANAESGLKLAYHQLTAWPHSQLERETWHLHQSTSQGAINVVALSVQDNNELSEDATEAIHLISTGTFGAAKQVISMRVVPQRIPLPCLDFGICAGRDIVVNSANIRGADPIHADRNITVRGSSKIPNALGTISGRGGRQAGPADRAAVVLPPFSELASDYVAMGTKIQFAALPTETPNLVRDPGMESGDGGWTNSPELEMSAVVKQSPDQPYQGSASLAVTSRRSGADGPTYDISHACSSMAKYRATCFLKSSTTSRMRFAIMTKVQGIESSWTHSAWQRVGTEWSQLVATFKGPHWRGELDRALLRIETDPSDAADFFVDDIELVQIGAMRRLSHVTISKGENPFGRVNPKGVYVLDCKNQDIQIEHCRLAATLILRNCRSVRIGPGPVNWHPPHPNMPALLVEGDLQLDSSLRGLSEHLNSQNYNSASTPFYPLGSNSTETEIYPSELAGLVYCSGTLSIDADAYVRGGNLLASGDIQINADVFIDSSSSSARECPPGFAQYRYRIVRGSLQR